MDFLLSQHVNDALTRCIGPKYQFLKAIWCKWIIIGVLNKEVLANFGYFDEETVHLLPARKCAYVLTNLFLRAFETHNFDFMRNLMELYVLWHTQEDHSRGIYGPPFQDL